MHSTNWAKQLGKDVSDVKPDGSTLRKDVSDVKPDGPEHLNAEKF